MSPAKLTLAPPPPAHERLAEAFALEALEGLGALRQALQALAAGPARVAPLNELLQPLHTLRANAATVHQEAIHRLARKLEILLTRINPLPIPAEPELLELVWEALEVLTDQCSALLPQEADGLDPPLRAATPEQPGLEDRLELAAHRHIDPAHPRPPPIGELLIQQGSVSRTDLERVLELQRHPTGELLVTLGLSTPDHVLQALQLQREHGHAPPSVRTEVHYLDELASMAAEMGTLLHGLQLNSAAYPPRPEQSSLARIVRQLWERVHSLRTGTLEGLFSRLSRQCEAWIQLRGVQTRARDVRQLQHRVRAQDSEPVRPPELELRSEGAQAEVLAEHLNTLSPLLPEVMRILLDSIGQALDLRRTWPPNPPVKVHLSATQGPLHLRIAFELGARGLRLDRNSLSEHRQQALLKAGERVGGVAHLELNGGESLVWTLELESGARQLEVIAFRSAGRVYALPASDVREYVRPTLSQCQEPGARLRELCVRDGVLPLVWLESALGRCPGELPLWNSLVLVLGDPGEAFGVVVEELMGPQRILLDPRLHPASLPRVSSALLECGQSAELLSIAALRPHLADRN